jgi:hypothetical protein
MQEGDNQYARPIDGLMVIVDLAEHKVSASTTSGSCRCRGPTGRRVVRAVPRQARHRTSSPSTSPNPTVPSFTVDGDTSELAEVGPADRLDPPRGPGPPHHHLHRRRRGPTRPVPRVDVEMTVPYGDPSPTQARKNAFDVGEYGLGMLANPLTLGCDCLGEIHYLDAHVSTGVGTSTGSPRRSASTRRTSGSPGSTPTSGPRTWRCAGCGGSWCPSSHRRQLRVRHLLVPLPGRSDRERDQAHRDPVHRRARTTARPRGTAPSSVPPVRRATTSTSSACGWTCPSTASTTPLSR